MARPRAKKKKVSSGTHTRSVFLYGSPNAEKRSTLEKLQADYTDAVNFYISLLSDREDCFLQLLKNDKKDPLLRKLEKESRIKDLSSAYSQNAFDEAVTKLHNRLDNIRKDVIAATSSVSSILWNGHYYTIYDSSMDWESAKKYCKKQGGHLVTITSKEEQEKICSHP